MAIGYQPERSLEDELMTGMVVLMKEFHWTRQEMLDLPFSTYFILFEELTYLSDKETEQIEKSRKGKK